MLLKPSWLAGLFVFPLDEGTTVVGFEAVICQRAVTVQIKDKAKIDDMYSDSISFPDGGAPDGGGERVWSLLGEHGEPGGRGGGREWVSVMCCGVKETRVHVASTKIVMQRAVVWVPWEEGWCGFGKPREQHFVWLWHPNMAVSLCRKDCDG